MLFEYLRVFTENVTFIHIVKELITKDLVPYMVTKPGDELSLLGVMKSVLCAHFSLLVIFNSKKTICNTKTFYAAVLFTSQPLSRDHSKQFSLQNYSIILFESKFLLLFPLH